MKNIGVSAPIPRAPLLSLDHMSRSNLAVLSREPVLNTQFNLIPPFKLKLFQTPLPTSLVDLIGSTVEPACSSVLISYVQFTLTIFCDIYLLKTPPTSPAPHSQLRAAPWAYHSMDEPPYQNPPLNGTSPIGNLPYELIVEVFCHLPKPKFVSGDLRVENRSAVLQVCRQWREVAAIVLRESLDLSGSEEKRDSWVAYSERQERVPLVVDLCVNKISTSILESISGVDNLVFVRLDNGTFEVMFHSDECPNSLARAYQTFPLFPFK